MFPSYPLLARPDGPNSFLEDHLSNVSKNCQTIFSKMRPIIEKHELQIDFSRVQCLCKLIGGGHDIGKATKYFQEYVRGKKVNQMLKSHSPLSSFYVYASVPVIFEKCDFENDMLLRWIGLNVVLNHHGALTSLPKTYTTLRDWVNNGLQDQINAIDNRTEVDAILQKIGLPPLGDFVEMNRYSKDLIKNFRIVTSSSKKYGFTPFYLENLIFSSLIDADRMDAAGVEYLPRRDINAEIVKNYAERISKEHEFNKSTSPERLGMRKRLFSEIELKAKNVSLDRRIYSLTAPTGCGKTLAGLYFALILRDRISVAKETSPRIIYVAPFLSILDQNFEVFRKVFEIPREEKQTELLLQHHHLSELSYKTFQEVGAESYSSAESEILIEGWNAEIIVTTFVQFLNTILGARASQLRKFHNLVGSIVILDEVQCVPAKWWLLIRESLKFLAQRFKMYFVLMTATQPIIFDPNEIDELVENQQDYFANNYVTLRVGPRIHLKEFTKEVIERIENERKSMMILMNTIGSATYTYNALTKSPLSKSIPLEYLSAELLPVHRAKKLENIHKELSDSNPLVLVTTQVVEAGVNLDFDTVIRDMGPVDSIIQATGRCNREGIKDPTKSTVEIFEVYDEKGTFCKWIYGDFSIEKARTALTKWKPTNAFSDLAQLYYLETREGLSDEKSKRIIDGLMKLDYERLGEFVVIEEVPSRSVFVEFDEKAMKVWKKYESLEGEMDRKQKREKFLEIKNDIYNYVINIPEKYAGAIPQDKGFWFIGNDQIERFYDERTGFKREVPSSVI